MRIGDDRLRINHGHASLRGKPEPPVACLPTGRLPVTVAFRVEQAIFFSIRDGRDRLNFSRRKVIKLLFANTIDAAVAAHPEIAAPVFEDTEDPVVEESLGHRVTRKLAVAQPGQSAVVRADPERAFAVLIKRSYVIAG